MKKNKYLYQLILTTCPLIIVPTILFFIIFYEKSYKEIKETNTEYYTNMSRLFVGTIVNKIDQKDEQAVTFSVTSKDGVNGGNIFYGGTKKMSENAYYYWEACRELIEYNEYIGDGSFGIYYYDADFVLCNGSKCSLDEFLKVNLNVNKDMEKYKKTADFFAKDNYKYREIVFAPVYHEDGTQKSLLIGLCSRLGKDNERVMLFSELEPDDIDFLYQSAQSRYWEKYYIVDNSTGEVLFGIGDLDGAGLQQNYDIQYEKSNHDNVYVTENEKYNLVFVVDASENEEENIVHIFYNNVRVFILYILIIMTIICCLAVYCNYRPLYRLMEKIKGEGNDEFDIIYNSWNTQQLLIMDLVMNHLIYGLPISKESIRKLGIDDHICAYCVFYIDDYVLNSKETKLIMEEIENQFCARLLITDLQGEKSTVIISFLEKDNAEDIGKEIHKWCTDNIRHNFSFFAGCTVKQVNNISKSLDSCKAQLIGNKNMILQTEKKQALEKSRSEKYDQLVNNVLSFLEAHYYEQDLSQDLIANQFHVSVYTISRMFKKQFGVGFSEYVNGKRLEKAKELLVTTDQPIKDILIAAGFSNANYFTKLFKQNFGCAPSEFRNNK